MTHALSLSHNALVPTGNLQAYCQSVYQTPKLSREEEQALARRWHEKRDLDAARRLTLSNLRFVVHTARSYAGYGLSEADLIQEGTVGLMKAIQRFDPSIGVRLISFAIHWIKSEIHDFILKNWRIVKIATTKAQRKLFFNLRRAKKRLSWFSQEEVSHVASELSVSTTEVQEMEQRLHAIDASIYTTDADESDCPRQYRSLPDHDQNPAKLCEQQQGDMIQKERLHRALATLSEREQKIIRTRWLSDKKTSLQTLAKQYKISAERIRQIEQKALGQLQDALH